MWPPSGLVNRASSASCQNMTHWTCLLTEVRCLRLFKVSLICCSCGERSVSVSLSSTLTRCVFLQGLGLFVQHMLDDLSTSSHSLTVKCSRTGIFLRNTNFLFFFLSCFHINNCKRLGRNSTFLKDVK